MGGITFAEARSAAGRAMRQRQSAWPPARRTAAHVCSCTGEKVIL